MATATKPAITITKNKIPQIAAALPDKIDQAVRKGAFDIEALAKTLAPVDTGTLRNSIAAVPVAKYHWRVQVGANYGVYVEYGTSKMAAQPFMTPAVNKLAANITRAILGAAKEAAS